MLSEEQIAIDRLWIRSHWKLWEVFYQKRQQKISGKTLLVVKMWSSICLREGICDIISCINRGLSQRWLLRRSFLTQPPQLAGDLDAFPVGCPHSDVLEGHLFQKVWNLSEYFAWANLKDVPKVSQHHDLKILIFHPPPPQKIFSESYSLITGSGSTFSDRHWLERGIPDTLLGGC